MTKGVIRVLRRCLLLFISFPIFLIAIALVLRISEAAYENLYKYLPELFPLHNPILESELHERYQLGLYRFSLLLGAFFTVAFSLRYDNERQEYFIGKTDGFFEIPSQLGDYCRRFLLSDVIASLFVSAALSVPISFIPERFMRSDNIISQLAEALFGSILSVGAGEVGFFLVFSFVAAHIPSVPMALSSYRAKWLTGFE